MAEVSGQLGKSLVKFCSGELGPEGILPDTQLLDPLLKEASTAPLAQPPDKGMDGEARVGHPSSASAYLPCPLVPPTQSSVSNTRISCRSTLLYLHLGDHRAAQGCHCSAQQVRGPWALSQVWRVTPGCLYG